MSDQSTVSLAREIGEQAFGLDAEGYHAARLAYPEALYDELFSRLEGRPSVLEIGAGTGLVTQALLSRDISSVTAIEPHPALASFTERRLRDPRLSMVRGTFPQVQLSARFNLIACAAAFHWMEPVSALAKIRELLLPGGLWAMWWHSYRNPGMGDSFADRVTPLLKGIPLPPSATLDQHYSLDESLHRKTLGDAGFRPVEYRLYRTQRDLTTDAILALYESYSFVRVLSPDRRARLLDAIASLAEREFGGIAPNLVLTPVYFAAG